MRRTPPVPDHTIRSATFHIPLWLPSFGSRSYLAADEKRPADRSKLILYAAAWFVGPTFPSQFGSWWASVHKESHPFRWDIRNQTNSSSVGITQYHPGLGCVVLTVSLAISHCLLNFTWYPLEQTFFLTNQEPIFMAGSRPAGLWRPYLWETIVQAQAEYLWRFWNTQTLDLCSQEILIQADGSGARESIFLKSLFTTTTPTQPLNHHLTVSEAYSFWEPVNLNHTPMNTEKATITALIFALRMRGVFIHSFTHLHIRSHTKNPPINKDK